MIRLYSPGLAGHGCYGHMPTRHQTQSGTRYDDGQWRPLQQAPVLKPPVEPRQAFTTVEQPFVEPAYLLKDSQGCMSARGEPLRLTVKWVILIGWKNTYWSKSCLYRMPQLPTLVQAHAKDRSCVYKADALRYTTRKFFLRLPSTCHDDCVCTSA